MIRRPPRSTLLSLHDALPISLLLSQGGSGGDHQHHHQHRTTRISFLMPFLLSLGYPCGIAWSCLDRKSTRLNSSHANISYAVFCLKKKKYAVLLFSLSYWTLI